MVKLKRRRRSRIAAGLCGVALCAAALGWVTFCFTARPGPGAVKTAQAMLYLMSLVAVPMLIGARGLLLDALAGGEIIIRQAALTIILPRTLRRPIKIDRAAVAGIIIDTEAVSNANERLRFAVDGDSNYLYSSMAGSALPLLSPEGAVPNLAIVFERPLMFSEPRRRFGGFSDFAPLRPLRPSSPVPGVMLQVADPESACCRLAAWNDPERMRAALRRTLPVGYAGTRPPGLQGTAPSLRQPLPREHARRVDLAAAWALALAVFAAASRASSGVGSGVALELGMALAFCGGVLDSRLRYQERGGLARVASIGLAGTGLMIAFAVLAVSTTHN